MAIIEKPINVFTVANELGYHEYAPHPVTGQTVRKVDVGRLCTHANINKWAKYKPVRYPSVEELTEAQMHRQPASDTYHGIYIENSDSLLTLRDRIFGLLNKTHEYRRPRGGESEPFRVSDFNKYSQNGGGLVTTSGASGSIGGEMIVNVGEAFDAPPKNVWMTYGGLEPMESEYFLSKHDVYPSGYVHRGIMLTYNGVSYWKTGAVNWNNQILKSWLPTGTNSISVEAMQFMTNVQQTTLRNATSIPTGARFYAVLKDRNVPFSDNPYPIIVQKILAPGSLRYKMPPFLRAEFNTLMNRTEFTVRFDASVPEAGGGFIDDPTVFLVQKSDGRFVLTEGLGSFTLLNGEIKEFNGYFTGTASQNPIAHKVILMERRSERAETEILIKS